MKISYCELRWCWGLRACTTFSESMVRKPDEVSTTIDRFGGDVGGKQSNAFAVNVFFQCGEVQGHCVDHKAWSTWDIYRETTPTRQSNRGEYVRKPVAVFIESIHLRPHLDVIVPCALSRNTGCEECHQRSPAA